MESQRIIERKYKLLLQDVATNEFYTKIDLSNRVNCYVCKDCGYIIKTKDIDAGVTPFMISCGNCEGYAHSTFYKDIAPDQNPILEWYRPTLEQCLKMRNKDGSLDHILKGGLNSRKCNI